MFKILIVIVTLFVSNTAIANSLMNLQGKLDPDPTEHKGVQEYGLGWSQIPVVCGPTEIVQEYLLDHNFELESLSFGHENAHPDGVPVYMVSYFVNKKRTEAMSVITAPSGLESCMLYRAFGLRFPGIGT
tara:strand:+ start:139 stop:528 length:390 start_codon:yes stop_codon:yes gene_type:complete